MGTNRERIRVAASPTPSHSRALPLKDFQPLKSPDGSNPCYKTLPMLSDGKSSWGQTLFIVCNAPGSIIQGWGAQTVI